MTKKWGWGKWLKNEYTKQYQPGISAHIYSPTAIVLSVTALRWEAPLVEVLQLCSKKVSWQLRAKELPSHNAKQTSHKRFISRENHRRVAASAPARSSRSWAGQAYIGSFGGAVFQVGDFQDGNWWDFMFKDWWGLASFFHQEVGQDLFLYTNSGEVELGGIRSSNMAT